MAHAFGASGAFIYLGFVFYVAGLILVLANLILEHPVERPRFEAVFILPALVVTMFYINIAAAVLYLAITFASFQQYRHEFKKALKPFFIGFLLLFSGALLSVFYGNATFGTIWILGHLFETAGFASIILWVWQYLQLRIREEMILIFTSAALLISIVVTLAFSIILVGQIESATKASLLTNAKVLDLAVSRLRGEALAKTKFLSRAAGFEDLLARRNFVKLEAEASKYLESEELGFLVILDKSGEALLRAHALTQKEDNLSKEAAAAAALAGKDFVTIESSPAEKFSIRAASPLYLKGKLAGAIIAGFLLDNALVDNIKRITGLEMSVWEGDRIAATTLLNPDGRTRGTGIKLADENVRGAVLERGEEIVVRTEILSRPALASYLPIKNSDGKIVGMISSVKPQQEILALANATNRLTLVAVVILMLVLAWPVYLLTKRLSGEVG